MRAILLFVAALLMMPVGVAGASGGFDTVGSSCVPDLSGQNCGYGTTNAGVTFPYSTRCVGLTTLHFYCGIPNAQEMSAPTTLKILYTDTVGTSGHDVRVTYSKVNKSTGVVTSVASVVTSAGCTTGTYKTCSVSFSDTFNSSTYRYILDVTLEGTTGPATQIFYAASLR